MTLNNPITDLALLLFLLLKLGKYLVHYPCRIRIDCGRLRIRIRW